MIHGVDNNFLTNLTMYFKQWDKNFSNKYSQYKSMNTLVIIMINLSDLNLKNLLVLKSLQFWTK